MALVRIHRQEEVEVGEGQEGRVEPCPRQDREEESRQNRSNPALEMAFEENHPYVGDFHV